MPHKVRLKHPHASSPLGLKNGKAVPLDEATAFAALWFVLVVCMSLGPQSGLN